MNKAHAEVEIRGRYTKIGDLTVYYVGLPIVAPSWGIKDGFLYAGLYPQAIVGAARSTSKGGKSIADNEKFIALQKRLGVKDPCGFSFFDLPTTASAGGSTYQQLLLIMQYAGIGDLFGVPAPQPLMPPLDVILQHIAPAGSATWVDDAGVHTKSVTPFPGAKVLSEPGMFSSVGGVGTGAVALSVMLPALNRSRETAMRVRCAVNMQQVGVAVMMYANDNNGNYPQDLGALVKSEYLKIDPFICPAGNTGYPDHLGDMTCDQIAEWINEHSPYIYIGQDLTVNAADPQTIIMYEDPADHDFDGVNALFADGHIEFLRLNEARQRLEAQGLEMQSGKR
jgi:prepilin-type processing-associated H-X9-DG protein